ncbi:MAG: GxxExxY protein [Verrucomicrobiota bacterium]
MVTASQDELTEQVIGLAMKVHRALGPGFVEFVYRNALIHELKKNGIKVEPEKPLKVVYDGAIVGDFKADLFLDEWLLCELKAVRNLLPEHEVQLVNYLAALNLDFGLLMNFGGYSLDFKRKYRRNGSEKTGFKKRKSESLLSDL